MKKIPNLYTRRRMLQMMTRTAAGSLLLPSVMPSRVAAQSQLPGGNKKIVFVYCGAGATHRYMDMRPAWFSAEAGPGYDRSYYDYRNGLGDVPDNTQWEFSFSDSRIQRSDFSLVLDPLWDFRDQLTYLEGLSMTSTGADRFGDAHAQGHLAAMSGTAGSRSDDGTRSHGSTPSMDQRINDFLKLSDPSHRSMNYRLNISTSEAFHEFVYYNADRTGGVDIQRLPVEIDPQAAFDRIFGGQSGGTTTPLQAGQGAVLQLLNGEYSALANRLSSEDRAKIESHRALIADLEASMNDVIVCGDVQRPTVGNGLRRAELQEPCFEAFARLVAAGFSCGISRVASIGMMVTPPEVYGLPASAGIHHEYEHPTDPRYYFENPDSDWLARERAMADRNQWQVRQLARLAEIFKNTPDSTGTGNLLDSSLIVYVNEISHGNHGHDHWPVIMLGDFDGGVSAGRYIKYQQNTPNPWGRNYHNLYSGVAHTKLFVSVLREFGMEIDYLQTPSLRNATVDLSGSLPRLKL